VYPKAKIRRQNLKSVSIQRKRFEGKKWQPDRAIFAIRLPPVFAAAVPVRPLQIPRFLKNRVDPIGISASSIKLNTLELSAKCSDTPSLAPTIAGSLKSERPAGNFEVLGKSERVLETTIHQMND
jgi:hypothetical protein